MLRVAHVISARNYLGGAERIVRALVRAGAVEAWPQLVLNPFTVGTSTSAMVEDFADAAYEANEKDGIRYLPSIRGWVRERLIHFGPDVVHVHLFHASVLMASIGNVGEKARVLTHHHGDIYQASHRRARYLLDRAASRRYGSVVAVSDSVARFLIEHYAVPESRVLTIRNGWEGEPRFDLSQTTVPTVVTVANLRPEKDQETLLRAFSSVRAELPEARLVILGDGPSRATLENLSQELGLTHAATFAGTQDVWPFLASAHVFALSSLAEPLGIAAMEAMAAGLPVVATRVGGLPEVVQDGLTGLLVPARDPSALGAALIRLLRDEALAREMGQRGRVVVQSMTMSEMAGRYTELYRRLVSSNR